MNIYLLIEHIALPKTRPKNRPKPGLRKNAKNAK